MKRAIAILMALVCLLAGMVSAYAQVDLSSLSEAELKALQREIALKLCPAAESSTVIWDNEYVKVSFVSLQEPEWSEGVNVKLIVENKANKELGVTCDVASVNKWTVVPMGPGTVAANANLMGYVEIFDTLSEYGINSVDEINEITLVLYVFDGESYMTLATSDTITLTF